MKRSTTTAAPSVIISDSLYQLWHADHHGAIPDMVRWLAIPSVDRDRFLSRLHCTQRELSGTIVEVYSHED